MDVHKENETQLENKKNIHAFNGTAFLQCNGTWYPKILYQDILSFKTNFQAKDGDMLLATLPKSGTTWLKALVFSIVNRDIYPVDQSPFLTSNPHQLVLFDFQLHRANAGLQTQSQELEHIRPRIFATHLPYQELPFSIIDAPKCKIVYLCRNPLDQFVSLWYFYQNYGEAILTLPVEEAFELYFEGKQPFGPFWNHMLGYWNASLKHPENILFLKYEDLKDDIVHNVKKIAQFLGCPFKQDEEENGKIEEITRLCSFQSLKNMEVNKTWKLDAKSPHKNSAYFRKGEVGDWINHISPKMADRVDKIIAEKFGQSGLTFGSYVAKGLANPEVWAALIESNEDGSSC